MKELFKRGQKLSDIRASDLQALADTASDFRLRFSVSPPLKLLHASGGGVHITWEGADGFWAYLTEQDASTGACSWYEVVPITGGKFELRVDGRSGSTTSSPAYPVNRQFNIAPQYVWLVSGWQDTDGQEYLFVYDVDHKVQVDSNDCSPDYLINKLVAGTGIGIDKVTTGCVETLKIGLASFVCLGPFVTDVFCTTDGSGNTKIGVDTTYLNVPAGSFTSDSCPSGSGGSGSGSGGAFSCTDLGSSLTVTSSGCSDYSGTCVVSGGPTSWSGTLTGSTINVTVTCDSDNEQIGIFWEDITTGDSSGTFIPFDSCSSSSPFFSGTFVDSGICAGTTVTVSLS